MYEKYRTRKWRATEKKKMAKKLREEKTADERRAIVVGINALKCFIVIELFIHSISFHHSVYFTSSFAAPFTFVSFSRHVVRVMQYTVYFYSFRHISFVLVVFFVFGDAEFAITGCWWRCCRCRATVCYLSCLKYPINKWELWLFRMRANIWNCNGNVLKMWWGENGVFQDVRK